MSQRSSHRPSRPTLFAVVLAVAAGAFSWPAGAATYFRTTLDRVTVLSSVSARRCDRLAFRFMAFERVLLQLMGEEDGVELLPVALYELEHRDAIRVLYSPEEAAQMLASGRLTYSKFLPGSDFHLAVTMAGLYGDEPLQSALMFYAQTLMLSGPMTRRPPWFQLGLSHLVNGAMIRDDSSVLVNRRLQFRPVDGGTRPRTKYDLAAVLAMTSREANGADMLGFLEVAREFAAFGLLTTDDRRTRYRELSVLMQQGAPAPDAVRDAFGTELVQLAAEFERGDWKREVAYRVVPASPPAAAPTCAPVAPDAVRQLLDVVAARAPREPAQGT